MTPFSAPGAAAIPPRAQGAPTPAGAPRLMRGSYGNLGAAVRVAPSPTPRAQAPPTAPGIPIARPRVPMAPHAQGAPTAGAPRMMSNLGGAPMSAATPTPRMQAPPPQPGRAPGIPPNTRPVGVAVPSVRPHVPLVQPTQRTPAAVAPSLGKRETTTMGPAPIQQAKRQAPMPRPQGAPTGGLPLPTNPAGPAVGVRAPVPTAHAQGAPTAGNATPPRPPSPPQLPMFGVYQDPSKGWMARVVDPKRRVPRDIGPFDTVHLAALAHDRVAVAYAGRGIGPRARLNFETAFYRVETEFLQRWEGDVCEAVEKGEYEKTYAKFLKAGYKAALNVKPADDGGDEKISDGDEGDELIASCYDAELFWETIEDFFLNRPVEIGAMALGEGGELLRNRFVEMHRNKSLCPVWRRDDRVEKLKTMALQKQQHEKIQQQQQHIQMQQQQQQIQAQQQLQQQQIQMQPQQHQQQQIQMQRQQQIRQQQTMLHKQRQQQMMMAQQQQQYPNDDATLQVKQEI